MTVHLGSHFAGEPAELIDDLRITEWLFGLRMTTRVLSAGSGEAECARPSRSGRLQVADLIQVFLGFGCKSVAVGLGGSFSAGLARDAGRCPGQSHDPEYCDSDAGIKDPGLTDSESICYRLLPMYEYPRQDPLSYSPSDKSREQRRDAIYYT